MLAEPGASTTTTAATTTTPVTPASSSQGEEPIASSGGGGVGDEAPSSPVTGAAGSLNGEVGAGAGGPGTEGSDGGATVTEGEKGGSGAAAGGQGDDDGGGANPRAAEAPVSEVKEGGGEAVVLAEGPYSAGVLLALDPARPAVLKLTVGGQGGEAPAPAAVLVLGAIDG